MQKQKKKGILKKVFIAIFVLILLAYIVMSGLIIWAIRDAMGRGEYPDYPITTYRYDHYKDQYPRREVSFPSGENTLKAFHYPSKGEKLIVFAHGLGSGHEMYMNEIVYLLNKGFDVFAYDGTASGYSEGKSTKGLFQSSIDIEACYDYLLTDDQLKDLPIYALGHSWGGFAVAQSINYGKNTKAVCSMAAYGYPSDLMKSIIDEEMEMDISIFKPAIFFSDLLFVGPKNIGRNAIDSINQSDRPIFIIHGSEDDVVPLEGISLYSYIPNFTNPNVKGLLMEKKGQNGHNDILHYEKAVDYIEEKEKEFQKIIKDYKPDIPTTIRQKYVDSVDLNLVNHTNEELMDQIIEFFNQYE